MSALRRWSTVLRKLLYVLVALTVVSHPYAFGADDQQNSPTPLQRALRLDQLGDRLRHEGNLSQALKAYLELVAILKTQARSAPSSSKVGISRNLALAHQKLGGVLLELGRDDEAKVEIDASVSAFELLANNDPANESLQRDLSYSYDTVADLFVRKNSLAQALALRRKGLEIRERLSNSDPDDEEALRDLAVGFDRVGAILQKQGNLAEAIDTFQKARTIFARLANATPEEIEPQEDLRISLDGLASALALEGNYLLAINYYEQSLAISSRLAEREPDDPNRKYELAKSQFNLGSAKLPQGDEEEALILFRSAQSILRGLADEFPEVREELARVTKQIDSAGK